VSPGGFCDELEGETLGLRVVDPHLEPVGAARTSKRDPRALPEFGPARTDDRGRQPDVDHEIVVEVGDLLTVDPERRLVGEPRPIL
jgi:hypothetical protein